MEVNLINNTNLFCFKKIEIVFGLRKVKLMFLYFYVEFDGMENIRKNKTEKLAKNQMF